MRGILQIYSRCSYKSECVFSTCGLGMCNYPLSDFVFLATNRSRSSGLHTVFRERGLITRLRTVKVQLFCQRLTGGARGTEVPGAQGRQGCAVRLCSRTKEGAPGTVATVSTCCTHELLSSHGACVVGTLLSPFHMRHVQGLTQ